MRKQQMHGADSWYSAGGAECDVVLSTRVRLARNLANFPFPAKLRESDGERIQSIVTDAFNHLEDAGSYHISSLDGVNPLAIRIFQERGLLKPDYSEKECGIVLCNDGKISCTINTLDHIRIASFSPGFDFDSAFSRAHEVDEGLQRSIQFAASYDFGYLTSSVMDCGSGLKLSVRVHLPALSLLGRIASLSRELCAKGLGFSASYGSGSQGSSLGAFYQLYSMNSTAGTEFDQVATLAGACKKLVEAERAARDECMKNRLSEVRNIMYRSVALARYSMFVPLRESIELISGVKFGKEMGFLAGIEDSTIHGLLYNVQEAHLEYMRKSGDFKFEKDIASDDAKKIERLRALILQENFEDIVLSV